MSGLEEIKQYLVLLHNATDVDEETKDYIFGDLKVEWLIERVKELEIELLYYKMATESYVDMEQQNKRYREALEFYADRDNYKLKHFDPNLNNYMSTVDYDEGQKARQTIGSEKIND